MKFQTQKNKELFFNIQTCLKHCEYQTANDLLLETISKSGSSVKALHLFALNKYYEGDLNQAISTLKKAIEKTEKNRDLYISLSFLYFNVGKYAEAEEILSNLKKDFIKLQNTNLPPERIAEQSYENALILEKSGDYDAAIAQLRYALSLTSNYPEMTIALAKLFLAKNEFQKAQELLEKLCHKENPNTEAYLLMGLSFLKENKRKLARQYFEQANSRSPEDPRTKIYLEISNTWNIDTLI